MSVMNWIKKKKMCSLVGAENNKIWVVCVRLHTVHTAHALWLWVIDFFLNFFGNIKWIISFIYFFSIFVFCLIKWNQRTIITLHCFNYSRSCLFNNNKRWKEKTSCFFRFIIFVRLFIFKTMTTVCVSYHELSHARWSRIDECVFSCHIQIHLAANGMQHSRHSNFISLMNIRNQYHFYFQI